MKVHYANITSSPEVIKSAKTIIACWITRVCIQTSNALEKQEQENMFFSL